MKNLILYLSLSFLAISCNEPVEKKEENKEEIQVEQEEISIEERAEILKEQGYQSFTYKEGDSSYLMQQYYMVFLKAGENRNQDSTKVAELQKQHLEHLSRMAAEGFASLIGPFGDDGEIRGIVVYQTPTMEMADSLANLDPMVQAGRLEVEVHPWWTEKGGKLE
ncbi:MAG TPA: YciI family protein [Salinimicrobium sp.]|nr:YciI family protein [Salinimicrobium sp.]